MKGFKISKNVRNALFVFFVAFFAFFAFEPLLERLGLKATQEYAVAIFGTIITAVITMLLLTKQTETEEEKDRNDKVFEQKIAVYNQAVDTLQSIFENSNDDNQVKITRKEIIQIEFLLAKIMMVGSNKTIYEFKNFYQIVTSNYSTESSLLTLNSSDRQVVFRVVDYCREELGLSDKGLGKEVFEDIVLHGELLYNMDQVEKFDPETIETIKDIYGYLVFDLDLPYRNIDFVSDGINAYVNDKHIEINCFFKCIFRNQDVLLALNDSSPIKEFQVEVIDGQKYMILKSTDRKDIQTYFPKIEKAIKESYLHTKKGL